jgi:nitric oxide reductase subunit C
MLKDTFLLLVVFTLVVTACGGGQGAPAGGGAAAGDAARGKALYEQTAIGSAPACSSCHSNQPGVRLVGPTFAGLATEAAETLKSANYKGNAKTVEDFLHESIVNPEAYTAEGYPQGVMYQNYGKELSEQQVADLAAYIMASK